MENQTSYSLESLKGDMCIYIYMHIDRGLYGGDYEGGILGVETIAEMDNLNWQ